MAKLRLSLQARQGGLQPAVLQEGWGGSAAAATSQAFLRNTVLETWVCSRHHSGDCPSS